MDGCHTVRLKPGSIMIVVDQITKYYGARRALNEMSFSINEGEVVGFLGLNGAGKTTVFKILSGQLLPSAGRFSSRHSPLKTKYKKNGKPVKATA